MATPRDLSIGLSKKSFKVGKPNSFTLFCEGIAPAAGGLPSIYLTSRNHLWGSVAAARKHDDAINIDCRCLKRKKGPVAAPAVGDGDDDLTVTIVFDEGGGDEEVHECTVDEVNYDG